MKDPVCEITVDPVASPHHTDYAGMAFHFCSAGCKAKFIADPARYLAAAPLVPEAIAEGAMWTCPMHPQIRQAGPGSCPI